MGIGQNQGNTNSVGQFAKQDLAMPTFGSELLAKGTQFKAEMEQRQSENLTNNIVKGFGTGLEFGLKVQENKLISKKIDLAEQELLIKAEEVNIQSEKLKVQKEENDNTKRANWQLNRDTIERTKHQYTPEEYRDKLIESEKEYKTMTGWRLVVS